MMSIKLTCQLFCHIRINGARTFFCTCLFNMCLEISNLKVREKCLPISVITLYNCYKILLLTTVNSPAYIMYRHCKDHTGPKVLLCSFIPAHPGRQ